MISSLPPSSDISQKPDTAIKISKTEELPLTDRDTAFTFGGRPSSVLERSAFFPCPPLPSLPNYYVTLEVLSYIGYKDEVKVLLKVLSKNTQAFFRERKDPLSTLLQEWEPKYTSLLHFGQGGFENFKRPNDNKLRKVGRYVPTKLTKIYFKHWFDTSALCAI